ncbi:MAG: tetratricopeptide repeat protein [Candidatus Bilamarchaeaceae archaeon]
MDKVEEARVKSLLLKAKYRDAAKLLNDYLLKTKDDPTAWYLLGIISMRLKNYESAHEYFERSFLLKKDYDPLFFDGLAYLEMLDTEAAKRKFLSCIEIDPDRHEANFYLAICYLLEGNPLSSNYIKKAFRSNRERTLSLLYNFFNEVIEKNPFYSKNDKEVAKAALDELKRK